MSNSFFISHLQLVIQWKPLNVITLGRIKSHNINWMITISEDFYLLIYSKWDVKCDHIKRLLLHLRMFVVQYWQSFQKSWSKVGAHGNLFELYFFVNTRKSKSAGSFLMTQFVFKTICDLLFWTSGIFDALRIFTRIVFYWLIASVGTSSLKSTIETNHYIRRMYPKARPF